MVKILKRPTFKEFYEVNEYVAHSSPMMTHYHSHIPFERWLWKQKKNAIHNILDSLPYKSLVDLGCGDGGMIETVKPTAQYTGIDISPTQTALIKRYVKENTIKNATIKTGDILKLKEKDNTYDIALLCDVVEHVLDTEQLFTEASRVTKKNGFIIFSIPNEILWETMRALLLRFPLRSPDHINSISPHDIEKRFTSIIERRFIPIPFSSSLSLIHIFVVKNVK